MSLKTCVKFFPFFQAEIFGRFSHFVYLFVGFFIYFAKKENALKFEQKRLLNTMNTYSGTKYDRKYLKNHGYSS